MNVSIIIPVFNVAPYIENCLCSVMQQTYVGSMECLLVDDCGTDDSMTIAERMIEEYNDNFNVNRKANSKKKRICFRVLHHEKNRGLSAARNTGTLDAKGDYIFYLDSDDEITSNCIEKMMEIVVADPTIEMVQGNIETAPIKNLYGYTIKILQTRTFTNVELRRCFFKINQLKVIAWNKLVKRSFIVEHKILFQEGVIYEDTPWLFLLLKHLAHVCFLEDVTYRYRRRNNSIITGSSKKEIATSLERIYSQILADLTPGCEQEEIGYFGKEYAYFCARYSKNVPKFQEEIKAWQKYARMYGKLWILMLLIVGMFLGRTKYGWLLFPLMDRIEHPHAIFSDIQELMIKRSRR